MESSEASASTAQEVLWRARRRVMAQGGVIEDTGWSLTDSLDMAVPNLANAVDKPHPWREVPRGAKLRLIRRVLLKLIRPSSDRQDAINEGLTMSQVLILETARAMAERIDVLERRVEALESEHKE